MSETFEIHCKVDRVYQGLIENFNPAIRDVINAVKSHAKAIQVVSNSTSEYVSAIEKVAESAHVCETATISIGSCLKEIVQFMTHVEERSMHMIAAINRNFLTPLEKNMDQDHKHLADCRKRYKKRQKYLSDNCKIAQKGLQNARRRAASKRDRSRTLGGESADEGEAVEKVNVTRRLLDEHRIEGLRQALLEERKRYSFILDRQVDMFTIYSDIAKEQSSLLSQCLRSWSEECRYPDLLPPESLALLQYPGSDQPQRQLRIGSPKICSDSGLTSDVNSPSSPSSAEGSRAGSPRRHRPLYRNRNGVLSNGNTPVAGRKKLSIRHHGSATSFGGSTNSLNNHKVGGANENGFDVSKYTAINKALRKLDNGQVNSNGFFDQRFGDSNNQGNGNNNNNNTNFKSGDNQWDNKIDTGWGQKFDSATEMTFKRISDTSDLSSTTTGKTPTNKLFGGSPRVKFDLPEDGGPGTVLRHSVGDGSEIDSKEKMNGVVRNQSLKNQTTSQSNVNLASTNSFMSVKPTSSGGGTRSTGGKPPPSYNTFLARSAPNAPKKDNFPPKSVPVMQSSDAISNPAESKSSAIVSNGQFAQARHSYHPFNAKGQLEFVTGDLIHVIQEGSNGWRYGINLRTNSYGWFPASYAKVLLERKNSVISTFSQRPNNLPESLTTSFTQEHENPPVLTQRQYSQHNLSDKFSTLTRYKTCIETAVTRTSRDKSASQPRPKVNDVSTTDQSSLPRDSSSPAGLIRRSNTCNATAETLINGKGSLSSTESGSEADTNRVPPPMPSAIPVLPGASGLASNGMVNGKAALSISHKSSNRVTRTTSHTDAMKLNGNNPFAHVKLRQVVTERGEIRRYV